jgi:hypothetical protein
VIFLIYLAVKMMWKLTMLMAWLAAAMVLLIPLVILGLTGRDTRWYNRALRWDIL